MIIYSQRDERWADKQIGQSDLKMGRYGCTVCCVAMLTTYFRDNFTPDELLKKLQFTSDGLLIWSSCVFPYFKFNLRDYSPSKSVILAHLKDPKLAVILKVGNINHWVVAYHYNKITGRFLVADPWFGKLVDLKLYDNKITGAVYFTSLN